MLHKYQGRNTGSKACKATSHCTLVIKASVDRLNECFAQRHGPSRQERPQKAYLVGVGPRLGQTLTGCPPQLLSSSQGFQRMVITGYKPESWQRSSLWMNLLVVEVGIPLVASTVQRVSQRFRSASMAPRWADKSCVSCKHLCLHSRPETHRKYPDVPIQQEPSTSTPAIYVLESV